MAFQPLLSRHLAFSTAIVLFVTGAGCTDAGLEPARTGPGLVFDDELRLSGEVCLTPAADASFPVKVLFLVDTSDSMSVTDRDATRRIAVSKVLERYRAQPAVKFGIIAFDSRIDRLTDGFTASPDTSAIESRLSTADRLTDYQGALGAAYQMITEDIITSSPAERARSKYVVIFFSDGAPDPQCSSRVTVCGATECPAHQHCRAQVCKPDYLICTVAREDWETAFDPPLPPELYPELDLGADYNQPSQILRSVDDIIGLQDFYRVGEIRLHTAFLYDPEAASDPLALPFGLDREGGVELMTMMAEHGFGTFTEFDSASKVDFLSINYTSFKEENGLAMVLATNLNVVDNGEGLKADTDRDGLIDETEAGLTCVGIRPTCSDPMDSDGDGYTDLFEERNRVSGFDPKDPKKPLTPCSSKSDLDGDLLRDCEEDFLKTDSRLPDTDGDRIPDGIEFRVGMDPLDREDAYGDPDRDGERNVDEVKAHTNPSVAASASYVSARYLYDVVPVTKPTGQECFQLDVRHIKLMTTGKGTDSRLGLNRVLLYFDEAPLDRALDFGRVRIACVDVRYVDGAVKSPWDGQVALTEADFIPAETFDQAKHCKDLTSIPMPTDDAGVVSVLRDGGP
jgi:uncharacterized protein YegL